MHILLLPSNGACRIIKNKIHTHIRTYVIHTCVHTQMHTYIHACMHTYIAKADYQTAIRREKTRSWKYYCTLTPANNPWNEVYKIATGKTRNKQTLTTLQRPDGTVTETTEETIELMLEHPFPDDDPQKDTDQQKEVRRQTKPINTANDNEFT